MLVFPIKALKICLYIEIQYDAYEPRASLCDCYTRLECNDIIYTGVIIVSFSVNSVKPRIFLLTPSAYM